MNLGHGYALSRQWDQAVQALRQAAAVDPESQAVQAEPGAVLACQGNRTAALPHVRRSLRTDDAADPIELQNGDDETSRRTLIDSSTVYDLSGGADQSLRRRDVGALRARPGGQVRTGGHHPLQRRQPARATNGLVVNVGIKAGGGGASVGTGFYYQQDGGGKVVDYGWQASASVQAGGVVSMDLYDDTVRVSFMSAFSLSH